MAGQSRAEAPQPWEARFADFCNKDRVLRESHERRNKMVFEEFEKAQKSVQDHLNSLREQLEQTKTLIDEAEQQETGVCKWYQDALQQNRTIYEQRREILKETFAHERQVYTPSICSLHLLLAKMQLASKVQSEYILTDQGVQSLRPSASLPTPSGPSSNNLFENRGSLSRPTLANVVQPYNDTNLQACTCTNCRLVSLCAGFSSSEWRGSSGARG